MITLSLLNKDMNRFDGDRPRQDRPAEGDLPTRLADDAFYRALASARRRRVLYYLCSVTSSSVEVLATVLCGWEATTTETMVTPSDRRNLLVELRHSHLPRLAEAGLIAYESQTGTVRLVPLHPQVEAVIRRSVEAEQPAGS